MILHVFEAQKKLSIIDGNRSTNQSLSVIFGAYNLVLHALIKHRIRREIGYVMAHHSRFAHIQLCIWEKTSAYAATRALKNELIHAKNTTIGNRSQITYN